MIRFTVKIENLEDAQWVADALDFEKQQAEDEGRPEVAAAIEKAEIQFQAQIDALRDGGSQAEAHDVGLDRE